MTKQIVGTLRLTTPGQLIVLQGTLVEQTADYVLLNVKRRGSSKTDPTLIPSGDIKQAFLSEEQNETYITTVGELVEDHADITMVSAAGGFFYGETAGTSVIASPGTWTFLPSGEVEAAAPAKGGKAKATAAAEKPAAGKGKTKPEPEPEEEQEEEQEAEAEAEYEPEVGHTVTVTEEDGEETTGEVTKLDAKTITVDGQKFKLAAVTVVQAEATEPADDTPAEEEQEEEYEPEDGDYVNINDGEDDVAGTVTALTAKKITITDEDGEDHVFVTAKVTVTKAEKPKAAAKKPAGKPSTKEEKPAGKPSGKPAAGGKANDNDDW